MNAVFIGGSRSISSLNKIIIQKLDNITSNNLTIHIGDANGADKAVQKYLADRNYRNVFVYCMEATCRNNVGSWETRNIETLIKERNSKYYSLKDKKMAIDSSYGLMLWDSKSKGTLNNIINLLTQNKPTVVYHSPTKKIITLKNLDGIDVLVPKPQTHKPKRTGIAKQSDNSKQGTLALS